MNFNKNQTGFSLIELLIVVVIIGIVAAIAIPNLLASRRTANEGSAIASLRTIHGAQMTYQTTVGNGNFAGDTTDPTLQLTELAAESLIDSVLGSGTKSGYGFGGLAVDVSANSPAQFYTASEPIVGDGITQTGTRDYTIATDGVIYQDAPSVMGYTIAAGTITRSGGFPLSN